MTEHRTRALVLRSYNQRESDRIVHLYTEQLGRLSVIAKGARRSKKRFPGKLESLTVLNVRIAESRRGAMPRLEGATLVEPFEGLVSPLGRYAIASQFSELLDRLAPEREASPELFEFAMGVLGVLRSDPPDRLLALLVLVKTIARLGYRPQLAECTLCGEPIGSRDSVGFEPRHGGALCSRCRVGEDVPISGGLLLSLEHGVRSPLLERSELNLGVDAIRRLELIVDRFFRFHVGVELRSTAFLRQCLPLERLDRQSGTRNNLTIRSENAPTEPADDTQIAITPPQEPL